MSIAAASGVGVESVLALAARGLSVFPVPLPIPGGVAGKPGDGKTPAMPWKPFQTRRPHAAQIRQWFNAPQNVAIITGTISGVVVVDPDSDPALRWTTKHLPYTPWQTRTAKGFHLYYRHPGVPVRNKARIATEGGRLAIDIRGDGGFVIGPGSLHAAGIDYTEAGDWRAPVETLPLFRLEWLHPSLAVTAGEPLAYTIKHGTTATDSTTDRARRYLARIPRPEIGQGSDAATLYAAARLVRGFAIPLADAVRLLEDWAGGRPGWDRRWLWQKVSHAARYGSEPIGGLR